MLNKFKKRSLKIVVENCLYCVVYWTMYYYTPWKYTSYNYITAFKMHIIPEMLQKDWKTHCDEWRVYFKVRAPNLVLISAVFT